MNIDTIQCKRITSNWDEKKGYKPDTGELVYICTGGIFNGDAFIVIGMSNMTVEELYNAGFYFESHNIVESLLEQQQTKINEGISIAQQECNDYTDSKVLHAVSAMNPGNTVPKPVTSGSASPGSDSNKFSRVDHQHNINQEQAQNALGCNQPTNEWHCRRIMMKYNTAPTANDNGQQGDIWIVY